MWWEHALPSGLTSTSRSPQTAMGDPLLGDIHELRTGVPQALGSNLEHSTTSTRGCGLRWLGDNPALSKICPQNLNHRPHQTPQVPLPWASYRAGSGNESFSPLR